MSPVMETFPCHLGARKEYSELVLQWSPNERAVSVTGRS